MYCFFHFFVLLLLLLLACAGEIDGTSANTTENQSVLILTLPRSGSTFVGELFRQNPDFAYLFEPLRAFSEQFTWDNCKASPMNPDLERIMQAVYNCDFNVLKNALPNWGPLYSWDRIEQFSGHFNACLAKDTAQTGVKKLSVAIKEIENWAPKLNWLNSILSSELHVVWLVRDVRGWVSSWIFEEQPGSGINFYNEWGIDNLNLWGFYSGCGILEDHKIVDVNLLEKIKNILTNTTSPRHMRMAAWWTLDTAVSYYYTSTFKGKIKLVTYEDMASYPQVGAQEIYKFLGRGDTLPPPVQLYIDEHTQGGNVAERYATIRNSKEMSNIWQKRLTPDQIKDIEDLAGVWFPFFEYEKFK